MTEIASVRDEHDAAAEALIRQVGERVRRARQMKNLPRRALSERSGVSPRYLAQLEAGEGNISIGLLHRVALALDLGIEQLVGRDDPWASEAARVTDLFRAAPDDVRSRVLGLLAPEGPAGRRAKRICLIGLRGAGKSTLGAMAGEALGLPFVELNREIETLSGMPVGEVMALYDMEGYRRLEAEALEQVTLSHDALILAVAGGIVGEPETYQSLLDTFHTIWLQTSPEEHMSRVRAQGDERPMAGNPGAMDQLRSILEARRALYARASATLDTAGRTVDASLADLLALIETQKFLEP